MNGGRYIFLIGGSLLAAGCAASQELKIRPVGQSAVKPGPGSTLLAEARGQLALGNAGLALEAFRTLQRQNPGGADAYQGIAECYAAMGRYDLARTNYEFALAYAPNDPALLRELAGTLDRLGEHEQAGEVRGEAVRLAAAASPAMQQATVTPMALPRPRSVTVKLVEADPAAHPQPAPAAAPVIAARAMPATRFPTPVAQMRSVPPAPPPARPVVAVANAQVIAAVAPHPAPAAPPVAAVRALPAAVVAPATKISIAAAPPLTRPVVALASKSVIAAPVPHPVPLARPAARRAPIVGMPAPERQRPAQPQLARPQPVTIAQPPREFAQAQAPHLQRSSSGEVLLVTIPRPVQAAQLPRPVPLVRANRPIRQAEARPVIPAVPADRPVQIAATQVRWIPLKGTPQGPIQLLNAARLQGLAAHTRNALADRGWRRMAIGNARAVRQHSLVLYGPARLHLAKRLAAQFRCRAVKVGSMKSVVVLLGRDALRRSAPTARA